MCITLKRINQFFINDTKQTLINVAMRNLQKDLINSTRTM